MSLHNRKIKQITFDLGGNAFQCQVSNWQIVNNTEDGEKLFSLCPDGESREEADPDYALQLTFFSDWRSNGISDYLQLNDGDDVTFQVDHHPDIPLEHVRWNGTVRLKRPNVGGEARTTETQEITLLCIGEPVYSRP